MPKLTPALLVSLALPRSFLHLDALKLDGDLSALSSAHQLAFLSARFNLLTSLRGLQPCRSLWILDLQQNPVNWLLIPDPGFLRSSRLRRARLSRNFAVELSSAGAGGTIPLLSVYFRTTRSRPANGHHDLQTSQT